MGAVDVVTSQAALADAEFFCQYVINNKLPWQVVGVGGGDGRMAIILAMAAMVVESWDGKKWSPWCALRPAIFSHLILFGRARRIDSGDDCDGRG